MTDANTLIFRHYNAGNITRAMKDALLCLANMTAKRKNYEPSINDISRLSRVSRRMVCYALAQAEALGILTRTQRSIRKGWRVLRTVNAYVFNTARKDRVQAVKDVKWPWGARVKKAVSTKCNRFTGYITNNIKNKYAQGKKVVQTAIKPVTHRAKLDPSDWMNVLKALETGQITEADLGYSPEMLKGA